MIRHIIITCLLALVGLAAFARGSGTGAPQQAPPDSLATITGRVFTKHESRLSPVPNAFVSLISGKDTLRTQGAIDGSFAFKDIVPGKKTILATHIACRPTLMEVDVLPGDNAFMVQMVDDYLNISPAFVSAQVVPFLQRGDTIIFNAAAIKTMEGENALEVLRNMPGVEIKKNSIFINGQQVKRAYVNGLLLFGNEPMAPLNSILAEDVRQIKTYEEQSVESRLRGEKQGEQERVIDIITKEPLVSAWDAFAQVAGGADETPKENGSVQGRYFAGANANFFSERFLTWVNAYSNNLGLTNNRLNILDHVSSQQQYQLDSYASAGLQRYWGDRLLGSNFGFNYSYESDARRQFKRSLLSWPGYDDSEARALSDTTRTNSLNGTHSIGMSLTLNNPKTKQLVIQSNWNITNSHSNTLRRQWNRLASGGESAIIEDIGSKGRQNSGHAVLSWRDASSNPKITPSFGARLTLNPESGSSWTIDTSASSLSRRYISAESGSNNLTAHIDASVNIKLSNTEKQSSSLNLSYSLNYENSRRTQLAFDLWDADGPLFKPDTNAVNTFRFTRNYVSHGPTISYSYGSKGFNLMTILGFEAATQRDDEYFPAHIPDKHDFFLPLAVFNAHFKGVQLIYEMISSIPATEPYRDRLCDDNPLLLTAGNPFLKRAINHRFQASYSLPLPKLASQISFSITSRFVSDAIVNRRYYYPEGAYLEHFDYTALPGSTLSTYVNSNGTWDINGFTQLNTRIQKLGLTLMIDLGGSYSQRPYFQGDEKMFSRDLAPGISVNARLRPTKNLSGGLRVNLTYLQSKNSLGEMLTQAINGTASASLTYNIGKYLFISPKYSIRNHTFLYGSLPAITHHNLGAGIGARFLKGRMKITLSGNDLLNSGASYSIATKDDHTVQTWSPTYGRFYLLTVSFRLNKLQPKTQFQGESSTGDVFRHDLKIGLSEGGNR
jgi:hypothetical protein